MGRSKFSQAVGFRGAPTIGSRHPDAVGQFQNMEDEDDQLACAFHVDQDRGGRRENRCSASSRRRILALATAIGPTASVDVW